ncbi:MAG: GGDEF domain-containing response regulator [Pseudomonadota bacterium]
MTQDRPSARMHLLVVEDNPDDALLIEEYLDLSPVVDCTLHRVVRLAEAVEWLAENRVDAVLLDLGLPDSNGIETVRRFFREAGQWPLIVLTGHDDTDVGIEAIQLGAQDYLVKGRLDPDLLGRVMLYSWERNQVQSELRLLAAAFESAHAIFITNHAGLIERVNPAFEAVTGYSAKEAIGQTPALLKSGHHDPEFYRRMWRALEQDGQWSGEVWNRRRDGSVFPEWESITALRDEKGEVTHYVAIFHDITHQKELEAQLERRATHDTLTDILNRRKLDEHLAHEVARHHRDHQPLALVILDIDHFKRFNDTHGHQLGDRVLIEVVNRVGGRLRATDVFGRWGGEEFLAILPDTDLKGAAALAEELREYVASTPMEEGVAGVTISLGVATLEDDDSAEELLKRADDALYQAKEEGRDRIIIAS